MAQEVDLWRCPCCIDWRTAGDEQYVPVPRWLSEEMEQVCRCGAPMVKVPTIDLTPEDRESLVREEQLARKFANRYSRTNTDLDRAGRADPKNIEAARVVLETVLRGAGHIERFDRKRHDGWEFRCNLVTIKAYGARPGGNLLVKPRKVYANIYVLVHTDGSSGGGTLAGWTTGSRIQRCELQIMRWDGKYRQPSHFMEARKLSKDWTELRRELGLAPRQESLL